MNGWCARNIHCEHREAAERDKLLSEIGVKFTKEYFMKRYNLGERDFEIG